jgi:RNA polymerase sigma factor (sigma-70 family)
MATIRATLLLEHLRQLAAVPESYGSDEVLLRRFATDHDESAFAALLHRHASMVLGVCQRLLPHAPDAEDAFQATFLVLLRKAGSLQGHESLSGWLHETAHRLALKARALAARRAVCESKAPDRSARDPLADITGRELLAVLDDELARLSEKLRTPLILCCLEGATRDQAARQLGWSVRTLKRRLERGRAVLQARLRRRGLMSSAAAAMLLAPPAAPSAPTALLGATARAATQQASAGALPTPVAALVEAAMNAAGLSWVKLAAVVLLALSLTTAGVGALVYRSPTRLPPENKVVGPASDQPRQDLHGDSLPAGAVARLGLARLHQGGAVLGLAFAPNGKIVASCGGDHCGEDRAIHLWDVATGKEAGCLRGYECIQQLRFSPDGKLLASAGWGSSVRLWDVATYRERLRCSNKAQVVRDLAFSPDGKLLAAIFMERDSHSVTLWDTATGKEVRTWTGKEQDMWSLAFTPDGATLATAGPENLLHLWDVSSGTERRRIEVDKAKKLARPLAFSPDGKMVALANDEHTIRLWDAASGRELAPLRGHKGHIWRLAFSKVGTTLVSASEDRTIRFWDTTMARQLRAATMPDEISDCCAMAFSPDEKVLALGGIRNTIRLFDTNTGNTLHPRDGHTSPVEVVGFLPQGDMVASVGRKRVLAQTATGKERHRSPRWPGYTLSMVLSQSYGNRLLIDPVALAGDCSLVAVPGDSNDNGEATVRIWEVASDREVGSFTADIGSVRCLAFSPDKRILVLACGDNSIRIWDVAARKEVRRLTGHQGDIFAVAFSPDGKLLASGCTDKSARVWELATGKEMYQLRHESSVLAVAFSPDSRSLACAGGQQYGEKGGDTAAHVWELATGQERVRLSGNHHLVSCLAFAPDGKVLALGTSDGSVRVWDPMVGNELRRLEGHRGVVKSVAFSRDGKRLVSGSTDTTVLIWDTTELITQSAPTGTLVTGQQEVLWRDLASADSARAYRAMRTLLADRQETVRFLKDRLRPIPPTDSRQIARWVSDLDADDFAVREKATAALVELGDLAAPALRRALANRPSAELRRRVESLLGTLAPASSPELLRAVRAVEVLERLATPEARGLLTTLAHGAPDARLTREATAALDRLKTTP